MLVGQNYITDILPLSSKLKMVQLELNGINLESLCISQIK